MEIFLKLIKKGARNVASMDLSSTWSSFFPFVDIRSIGFLFGSIEFDFKSLEQMRKAVRIK